LAQADLLEDGPSPQLSNRMVRITRTHITLEGTHHDFRNNLGSFRRRDINRYRSFGGRPGTRGRGASGDTAPWALSREVEDLDAVIATAGGSACVFGTSAGAIFALQAAAGSAITKMVLWEPPFVVDDSRTPPPSDYATRLESFVTDGRQSDALEYFFTQAVGMPAEIVGSMKSAPFWSAMEKLIPALVYDAKIIGDFAVPANVSTITTSTLVLDGATTPWITAGAAATATAILNSARQTLAGQPHNVAADAIAPVITDFFNGAES
jgi:hypothetical protein